MSNIDPLPQHLHAEDIIAWLNSKTTSLEDCKYILKLLDLINRDDPDHK